MALVLSDEEVAMLIPEGKTKQEEIREGIAVVAEDTWYKHDYDVVWDEVAKAIVAYLHSQGVVIKVDRKLPEMPPATKEELEVRERCSCQFIRHGQFFNTLYCGLTGDTPRNMEFCKYEHGVKCTPEEGIAKYQAGYVAVETIAPSDATR